MGTGTRDKMISGAVELMRQRGVNATSVREVVRYTDTPRGSIRHHFPNGRLQLVEEAVALAGLEVSVPMRELTTSLGALAGLRMFIGLWKKVLEAMQFQFGCPVLAVAIEQYIGEDGNPQPEAGQRLLRQADAIFSEWRQILEVAMVKDGVEVVRARRLATLIIASIEGTAALCRAANSSAAIDDLQAELELALMAALPATPAAAGGDGASRQGQRDAES